jgi:hypothetical protein
VWPRLAARANEVRNDVAAASAIDLLGPVEQVAFGALDHWPHVGVHPPRCGLHLGAVEQLQLLGGRGAVAVGLLGLQHIGAERLVNRREAHRSCTGGGCA